MSSDAGPIIGSNVAQAFRSASDMRRLLAKLRGDLMAHEDAKGHSNGSSHFLPSSKTNTHRKYTLDEYILIANCVFAATFETATISVLDLKLSVGELISTAFHNGIGRVAELLTIGEHDRQKNIESAAKSRAQELFSAKDWCESLGDIPSISVTWPYEVLFEMIQISKSNESVTDSILLMWHLNSLAIRKIPAPLRSVITPQRNVSEPLIFDAHALPKHVPQQSVPASFIDEDLQVRISNRRRISRHHLSQSLSETVRGICSTLSICFLVRSFAITSVLSSHIRIESKC